MFVLVEKARSYQFGFGDIKDSSGGDGMALWRRSD